MVVGSRIIMHVDMDSFFASVEVFCEPSLAGMPVIVGANPKGGSGRGVVSTCSYEARRYGVRSGMPISWAYTLCPHGVYLPVNRSLYSRVSGEIMAILGEHADEIEQVSIDEAYLDVTSVGSFSAAEELATAIKSEIRESEGLTCSIGIAPGKVAAKIASDHHKPDGLTIVRPDEVASFLAPLPVKKIPGVGKKTSDIFARMGILYIGDLADCDVQAVIAHVGRSGIRLHRLARGIDDAPVQAREGCKSISRETTFAEDTADFGLLYTTTSNLADEVSKSLVADGLRCRTVTVKVRYRGFRTHTRSRTLDRFIADPEVIRQAAGELLLPFIDGTEIRLVGVRLSELEDDHARQTSIYEFLNL